MKRKRYTEQQILEILGQLEAGTPISDLSRLHEVAITTISQHMTLCLLYRTSWLQAAPGA
ncbi:transposase [Deinococcus enclensis]|uniref:transposase n=1 Tax=Deinococcus enclensis TaxID=1049582 RepID=UPI00351C62F1